MATSVKTTVLKRLTSASNSTRTAIRVSKASFHYFPLTKANAHQLTEPRTTSNPPAPISASAPSSPSKPSHPSPPRSGRQVSNLIPPAPSPRGASTPQPTPPINNNPPEIHPPIHRRLGRPPPPLRRRPQPLQRHPLEPAIPQPPSGRQPAARVRRSGDGAGGRHCGQCIFQARCAAQLSALELAPAGGCGALAFGGGRERELGLGRER